MKKISKKTKAYIDKLSLSIQEKHAHVRPLTASLQVNKWCNSKCEYCGIWKSPMMNPSLEDLTLAIDELSGLGVQMISLTGGEPFLHDKLPQIVEHMKAREVISSTMTNGLLLKPKYALPVLEAGLNSLCVSLDTVDPIAYKKIRGVPLSPILKGLKYISSIRREFPSFFVFSINCVISKVNIEHIPSLVEFCSELDISMGFQPLHRSFDSRHNPEELQFFEDDLPYLHKKIDDLIQMKQDGYRIDNDFAYLKGFPEFLVNKELPDGTVCSAGFTTISVDYKLDVRSCWPMKVVGNLHISKLKELWFSEEYDKKRASMLELNCPKCWLRCHTDYLSVQWLSDLLEKITRVKSNQPIIRHVKS